MTTRSSPSTRPSSRASRPRTSSRRDAGSASCAGVPGERGPLVGLRDPLRPRRHRLVPLLHGGPPRPAPRPPQRHPRRARRAAGPPGRGGRRAGQQRAPRRCDRAHPGQRRGGVPRGTVGARRRPRARRERPHRGPRARPHPPGRQHAALDGPGAGRARPALLGLHPRTAGATLPQRRRHRRPPGAAQVDHPHVPPRGLHPDAAHHRVQRRLAGAPRPRVTGPTRRTADRVVHTSRGGLRFEAHRTQITGKQDIVSTTPTSGSTPAADQQSGTSHTGTTRVKRGMAEMLKGGVIMDVVTAEQAKIAEDAGAVAVMALERVPADIRAQGGVSRMSDPDMIDSIIEAVSVPVMAKARIGHFVEAQVLQSLGVDYIDESEVLTPADYANHIDKWQFTVPFVCGATNLGEALRRITEGAAMIRSKGEAGTGDVSNAVTHMRTIRAELRRLQGLEPDELYVAAKELQASYDLVREVAEAGKLPVVLFTAGGIATPADAAIVKATTFFDDPDVVAKVSRGLGEAMVGINVEELPQPHRLSERGW